MKIDDNFSPSSDLRSQLVHRTPDTRTDQPGGPRRPDSTASDSASLSSLGVELSRAIQQEPPELVARIQRLQEAIANGTYSVPSSAVASKIVGASLGGE
jgi:flagellar biosynthesis anti-sigma factor FlgM